MHLSPDEIVFWQYGFFRLNATIVYTWGLMFVLAVGSMLVTRKLSKGLQRSRWQNLLEIIVTGIEKQIREVGLTRPEKYLGFLGSLFLFVAMASLFTIVPGYEPPTGSLSTTAALAICVFVAVPMFGIEKSGVGEYLKAYLRPTVIMLPFNIISELSRTLALAVRLFGNMMSGTMILAILLHLQHSGHCLHRCRHTSPNAQTRTRFNALTHELRQTKGDTMDSMTIIAVASIVTAGLTIAIGVIGPSLGEGRAVGTALTSLAQQPDASATITRTLFVGLAMIESTAIYCFVVSLILIFANPFWNSVIAQAAGK